MKPMLYKLENILFMNMLYVFGTIINVITVASFYGMNSVAETNFQIVVIAGIAIFYGTVVNLLSILLKIQVGTSLTSSNRFIYNLKLENNPSYEDQIADFEEIMQEDKDGFNDLKIVLSLNQLAASIIWLGSIYSILTVFAV